MNERTPTDRELEALRLLARGLSSAAVARSLAISESTLRRTLRGAREALAANGTVNAIYLATRKGLI
jgi:DNA-binding CsgD family transcriptional regulator